MHNELNKFDKEEVYKALLDAASDQMSLIDKKQTILWANKFTLNKHGKNIIGMKCYSVYKNRAKPCEPYPCHTIKTFNDGKTHCSEKVKKDEDGNNIWTLVQSDAALRDKSGDPIAVLEISRNITDQKLAEKNKAEQLSKLKGAISDIKKIDCTLPICSHCKDIRNEEGGWEQIEFYIRAHAGTEFTHSICPSCCVKHYPELKIGKDK